MTAARRLAAILAADVAGHRRLMGEDEAGRRRRCVTMGDGNHYSAPVVSAAFKGKSGVQQHQMVYAALKGRMGGDLHALALQTSDG